MNRLSNMEKTTCFRLLSLIFLGILIPFSLPANVHSASATLAWDGNSDPEIGGYKLYYGTLSGDYQAIIDAGNNTICTAPNLLDGTTYYFAATCYSTSGEESGYSNEVVYYTPPTCTSLSPEVQSFNSSGGTGTVSITGQAGCSWDAHSNAPWLIITSNSTGSGNETVNYSVSANSGADSRSGTLTIVGKIFTVSQSGIPCSYSISPASQSINVNGGRGFFVVFTSSGCSWTATSDANWITFRYGSSGTGSKWVLYSVSANTGPSRTGILMIGTQTFTVTQQGQD